jgi:N-acyl-D-amino-acid deacylase
VLVTSYRPDPGYVGKTIADIAAIRRTDPVTATIDMIRAAGPGIGIIGTSMDEADMEKFLAHPDVLISSDGSPIGRHPRGYGAFPRVLARYVRDRKVVSLSDAIAKMTGRTAAHVGLTDRGTITPGKRADVVVFDARAIQDRGTPQSPSLEPVGEPVGVRHVIVNGEVVLHDRQLTGARPGRGVRRLVLSPSGSARARAIGWTSP